MAIPGAPATTARVARRIKPRRPWMLIAACLLLVGLTVTLWGKWVENRERADRLAAELKKVYVEAEKLRTEATVAKQRITQLERQLRRATRAPDAALATTALPAGPCPIPRAAAGSAPPSPPRCAGARGSPRPRRRARGCPPGAGAARSAPAPSPTLTRTKFACEGGDGAPRSASAACSRGRSSSTTPPRPLQVLGVVERGRPRRPGRAG